MKHLILVALLFASGPAFAQILQNGIPTAAAIGALPAVNPNATGNGYFLNGSNFYTLGNASNAQILMIGPGAGASLPSGAQIMTGIGVGALESTSLSALESVGIGGGSLINATTGGGSVCIGTSACGATTIQGADIAIGSGVLGDGNSSASNFGIGALVMTGAASTITVGGTPTTGDVLGIVLSTTNACNGTTITRNCTSGLTSPTTYSYTVKNTDTNNTILAASIASSVTASMNGIGYILGDGVNENNRDLILVEFQIGDAAHFPTVLKGHYKNSWQIVVGTPTCSGACTETLTVGSGFSGTNNIVIGNYLFSGELTTNPNGNLFIGGGPGYNATTLSFNTSLGVGNSTSMTNGVFNIVVGYNSLTSCGTNCNQNVILGGYAGTGITTGSQNSILGDEAAGGQTCITSGNGNLELGAYSCVSSPTSNWGLSIQNAIFGTNNSNGGSNTGVSTGCVGFYTRTCSGNNSVYMGGQVVEASFTVSTLPTGLTGGHVYVTDATACAFGSTPIGGGSTKCPLFYNGSAWVGG